MSISPGAMALTRMPSRPKSAAISRVSDGQRRLRRRIGGAGERMHARAGDRGDVDHRALGRLELVEQAARQHDRREEIHLEHVVPDVARGVDRAEPLAARRLRRDRGVVDQRVQLAVQPPLDLGDRRVGVVRIGEIDLDVILRARLPRGSSPGRGGASR